MSRLAKYKQDPNERKRYQIDYSEWLDTGETVTAATFAITPTTVPPLTVFSSAIDTAGQIVSIFVEGGDDGATYEMVVTVTTSGSQIKEDEIVFVIRNTV